MSEALATPACIGEVQRSDMTPVTRDVENSDRAVGSAGATEGFMTDASPGVITMFLENQFYPSHEAYLEALAEPMRIEYEAVHASGLVLQIDGPDLAVGQRRSAAARDPAARPGRRPGQRTALVTGERRLGRFS